MARNTKTAATSITASDCLRNADTTNVLHDLNTPEGRLAARADGVPDAQLKATVVDTPSVQEAMASFAAAGELLQETMGVPSVTRLVCAAVVSLLISTGITAAALWGIPLLTAYAVAATGWAFMHYVVLVLGWLLAVIASWKLGGGAFSYISHKTIDRHAGAVTGWVKGVFSSAPATA
jgi:hypothetical protein